MFEILELMMMTILHVECTVYESKLSDISDEQIDLQCST